MHNIIGDVEQFMINNAKKCTWLEIPYCRFAWKLQTKCCKESSLGTIAARKLKVLTRVSVGEIHRGFLLSSGWRHQTGTLPLCTSPALQGIQLSPPLSPEYGCGMAPAVPSELVLLSRTKAQHPCTWKVTVQCTELCAHEFYFDWHKEDSLSIRD